LADASRPEPLRGCEACHGPGADHVAEAAGRESEACARSRGGDSAADRSAVCLKCHAGAESLHDFKASATPCAGVACNDCHRMHGGTREKLLAKKTPDLCYGCHLEVRAKFSLPEHHKVNEGVVGCLDCHRPHGAATRPMMRGSNDRTCFRCHGDLEGPFVFEHVGLVTEGCARCHDPHGSVNRHLLIRQQVAQLCYECHTVTPQTTCSRASATARAATWTSTARTWIPVPGAVAVRVAPAPHRVRRRLWRRRGVRAEEPPATAGTASTRS
jgi:DmsE family decaheme c-type cytochrome